MAAKKNLLIVVSGMDGSGKTTISDRIDSLFKSQGQDAQVYHGHGYSVSENSFGFGERAVKRCKRVFSLLLPFAYFDNLFTFYFKYRRMLSKKALVTDRYFYDKLARMLFFGICGEAVAKLYLRCLPRPDFVFFLDVGPQAAFERKNEYSPHELARFRQIYLFIARALGADIIDTTRPLEECMDKIASRLVQGAAYNHA